MSRNIKARLERIEALKSVNLVPMLVWADQAVPINAGARPVIRIGWMTSAEAEGRVW